jgi:hypothetical protein
VVWPVAVVVAFSEVVALSFESPQPEVASVRIAIMTDTVIQAAGRIHPR